MQMVQDELEQMREIKKNFVKFSQGEHLFPDFLAISNSLNKNVERLLSKPLPQKSEVSPWDLPHELKDIREALDQSKVLEEALKFKKEVIYKLWQEKIKVEKEAIEK
jgi:hypothetical protein